MLQSLNSLYYLDSVKGNYEEARQGYLDIINITKKQGKEDSLDLHLCEANLAGVYGKMELWSEAEPLLRKVITFFEANEIKNPFYTRILQRYADVLTKLGRLDEAEQYKVKAEELQAKLDSEK
jgi:tetratricopeptide (TPR) repeat protein